MELVVVFGLMAALPMLVLVAAAWHRVRTAPGRITLLIQVAGGIVVPFWLFVLSAFLAPEWTGAVKHGWIDGFWMGKLALLPLVIWAMAGFYARTAHRRELSPWMQAGLMQGVAVSGVTVLQGWYCLPHWNDVYVGIMALVTLVAAWYVLVMAEAMGRRPLSAGEASFGLVAGLPFWGASIWWSMETIADLPENPSDCFIVTAAARGHPALTGPRVPLVRPAGTIEVSRQLAVFWRFEAEWARLAPASHRCLRRHYNVWGYRASRWIHTPLRANAVHLALKPLEGMARAALWLAETHRRRSIG